MTRVGYIVVREDLGDPLVQSQCLDVIESINNSWVDGKVELIWFYRIDYLFRTGNPGLSTLRQRLSARGIHARFIPFMSLGFPVGWWAMPFVIPQWLLGIVYLRFLLGFRFFHCRSYHAGLIGFIAAKLFGVRYIFDPRSPFPEENVAAKRWGGNSWSNKLWKRLETQIINYSSATVLVCRQLLTLYHEVNSRCRFHVVPNNYPTAFEKRSLGPQAEVVPRYKLVYIGSFGHWNNPGPYLRLLSLLNRIGNDNCNMLFIVRTEATTEIERHATQYGVHRSLFDVVSVPQGEVAEYLRQCMCGVYLMQARDPRLGVKTVEYLSMGLPIIVSDHILGASELVRSQELGISWDHSEEGVKKIYNWIQNSQKDWAALAVRCNEFSSANFAPRVIASKLVQAYEEMVKE